MLRLLFFTFAIGTPMLLFGLEDSNVQRLQARVHALTSEAERLERSLQNMRVDSAKLSDEVNLIELERAVIQANIDRYEAELERLEAQIEDTESSQEALRKTADQQRERISERLRQLYKRGNLGYAQLFLKQSRRSELLTAYHYAKVLTKRDNDILHAYQETLSGLERMRLELDEMRKESELAKTELAIKEQAQVVLLKERASKLKDIRSQTNKQRRLLEELELEREELQVMVRRLTEDVDPWEIAVPIARYKGKLNWPTKGQLKRGFGIIRDPEFATKRRQNGWDIRAPKGREIRAVYSGRVLFADWFKSYGNLIILDHRDKITTFYAHCDRMLVAKGDYVERDQVIGFVGDTGSLEGAMLHFEIRNRTKPENPKGWLQRR
jgi:septal ring factor EnvC (AmiA/AmiB activator)